MHKMQVKNPDNRSNKLINMNIIKSDVLKNKSISLKPSHIIENKIQ